MSFFTPQSNIYKSDDLFLIDVFLPGVAPENLQVDVKNQILTVQASRKRGAQELTYKRDFRLNRNIDADAIEGKLENGRLQIKLPLANQQRKILIHAA